MALYDAQGNPLSVLQLRQILAAYGSGDENVPRVYNSDGDALGNGAGAPARSAINQELQNAGWDDGGASYRGPSGEYFAVLDDPNKIAQAQQLGVLQYKDGVPVANYNDPNLRGGEGSGALFADMPQTGFVQDILTNPAFLGALGMGAGFGSGLIGAGAEAGTVAGGGIGGGGGGAIASGGGLWSGTAIPTANALGFGTAEAGGAAGGALANGLDPVTTGEAISGSFTPATAGEMADLGVPTTSGSSLSDIFSKMFTPGTGSNGSTFGIPNNVLGGIATGVGGLLAANETGDAYRDVANQYLALGQPYRDRLNASYQPGFNLAQADPAFQNALDVAGQTSARALSTKYGNPADSPSAQAEMQKYLLGNVELPQLNTYRSQLGSFGNLGVNTAGTGSLAGANTTGQGYEAIGAGLGQALNPQPSLTDLFKQFGMGGNTNKTSLSIGGLPYGSK